MNAQPDAVRTGAVLGPGTKKEMFGGIKMRITGRIKANVFSALMITALLFLFGTSANAAHNRRSSQETQGRRITSILVILWSRRSDTFVAPAICGSKLQQLNLVAGHTGGQRIVDHGNAVLGYINESAADSIRVREYGRTRSQDPIAAALAITATSGSNSSLHVPVSLTLTSTAVTYQIVPTPSSLSFSGAVGATLSCQSVVVYANPATTLPVTLAGSAAWITVTPASGTTEVQPTPSVCVNTSGLAAGTYTGSMIITAPNGTGSNSPLHVPVSLTLTSSAVAPAITTQLAQQDDFTAGQTATLSHLRQAALRR